MAKDPAFLFYPNDWLGGTLGMSHEEKGIYMDLLILQFNRGHMTYDMMAHTIGQRFGQVWDKLSDKFEKDDKGCYYNARLEHEKERRKAYTASRYNNKAGKNQHTDKSGHMTSHMENENEDYNTLHNLQDNKVKLSEKIEKNGKHTKTVASGESLLLSRLEASRAEVERSRVKNISGNAEG